MNSPLAWIAIFLTLGILAGNVIRLPLIFVIFAAILFSSIGLFTLRRKIISSIFLSATIFFIGFLLFQTGGIYPPNHVKNFTPFEPESVYIEGLVIDEPQSNTASYGQTKIDFILSANFFQKDDIKQKATGKVKVFISGEKSEQLNYGDRILINGLLSQPKGPTNPGQFDYSQYLKRRGIFSILWAKSYDVVILGKRAGNSFFGAIYFVRDNIKEIICSHLPSEMASFLNAVLLGQRQDVDIGLNDIFMKTGTVHLLAVSGLHVGLLIFFIMLIFKIVRIPRKANILATILFLIFYAILTSGRPSVIRATIMAIVVLFGLLIGREPSIWNSLGLAAIIILGFDPHALFDVGFQLSFVSVASILYFTPKLESLFYYDKKLSLPFTNRCKRYLIKATCVSAAAWMGTFPFILYNFNIVTPIAILVNLFAVPLVFSIITSSISFIVFSTFAPFAGKIFAGTTWLFCSMLFKVTDIFSCLPLSYFYLPRPSVFLILVYYIFVIALIESKRLKISAGKIAIMGLVLINIVVWQSALKQNDSKLRVCFLDVGHGDSIFIEFPYGGNMLIDAGEGINSDMGRNVVLPFLRSKGINIIDAVVLTHPDSDHVGGLASVVEGLKVRHIFDNGVKAKNQAYRNFQDAVIKKGLGNSVLKLGDLIGGIKDTDLICLNPPKQWAGDTNVKVNDGSLVVKVKYRDVDLLFCADIEEKAIINLLKYEQMLGGKLIMMPHHGEKLTQAGKALIEKVNPKYAVISQGKAQKEILNTERTESFLFAKEIEVFRTNRDGAIFVVTDGKSIYVDSFKKD